MSTLDLLETISHLRARIAELEAALQQAKDFPPAWVYEQGDEALKALAKEVDALRAASQWRPANQRRAVELPCKCLVQFENVHGRTEFQVMRIGLSDLAMGTVYGRRIVAYMPLPQPCMPAPAPKEAL